MQGLAVPIKNKFYSNLYFLQVATDLYIFCNRLLLMRVPMQVIKDSINSRRSKFLRQTDPALKSLTGTIYSDCITYYNWLHIELKFGKYVQFWEAALLFGLFLYSTFYAFFY